MGPLHPYYPQDLIIDGYISNTYSAKELIGAWLVALSVVGLATFILLAPLKKLVFAERLSALWFVTCKPVFFLYPLIHAEIQTGGCIHTVFEGMI